MIKFGTDGWRGIIADTFTFENLRNASQGLADLILSKKELPKKIAIGFDRRFFSKEFARETACVMAQNGIEVLIAEAFLPTPVISWAAKNYSGLCGAVVITASHNPPCYNGFKFKEKFGCSAFPETTGELEVFIEKRLKSHKEIKIQAPFEASVKKGIIKGLNPLEEYAESLKKFIDPSAFKQLNGKVLVDPMNGAGSGYLVNILKSYGIQAFEIHGNQDPLFRGLNPEPTENNLLKQSHSVKRKTLC